MRRPKNLRGDLFPGGISTHLDTENHGRGSRKRAIAAALKMLCQYQDIRLTIKETAALCGVSRMTVWRWRTHEGLVFDGSHVAHRTLTLWLVKRRFPNGEEAAQGDAEK